MNIKVKNNNFLSGVPRLPLIVNAVILFFVVLFSIDSASKGASLAFFEKKSAILIAENRELEMKLISSSSLKGFEDKANEMGMSKSSSFVYLSESAEVAKLP